MGLRSRLSMMVVCWYPRFGIHDSILVVPQQQSANEPTGGIRAGSLSLGTPPPPRCWWFVVCGTLMRHPRNGCLSFRALRTERCPRFPAVFACITPRAACATCIQPYRACRILENHVRSGKKNSQPLWDISKLSSQIA